MNYQVIKMLIDALVKEFKCPNCQEGVNENNIEVVGAAGNSMNLDIHCSSCQKHTFIKSELTQINMWNIVKNFPSWASFVNPLSQNSWKFIRWAWDEVLIEEKQIMELRDIFKGKNINVSDFLGTS